MGVTLADGSYVIGEPTVGHVSVRTSFARMDVILEHIRFIRMEHGKRATIELRNGDRLTGVAEIGPLCVDCVFGRKSIDSSLISSVHVIGAYSSDTNLALDDYGATASCPRRAELLNDGNSSHYNGSSGFAHGSFPCTFMIDFPVPTNISRLRFLLWDGDNRSYKYKLEVTADGRTWDTVADYSNEARKSWQDITFEPRRIEAFRVEGLHNSANSAFHIVEMEAYPPGGEEGEKSSE